jgi:hypothetical protein
VARCIKCGGSSFGFGAAGVQCLTCSRIVPPTDVREYLALIDSEDEIVYETTVVYEEPLVSFNPELDEFDLRHGFEW